MNELAASGLQISLRDKLCKHALAVDLMRKAESGVADEVPMDSVAEKVRISVEEIAAANTAAVEGESDGDLQFFDPAAEKKARQAAAK